MTQDRSIKIFGKVHGVISTGDHAKINQELLQQDLDISDEMMDILSNLAERYAESSINQKQMVFQMEIQQRLSADPTFKQRFISAMKSGGLELIKVVTDNPFVSVPLETVKGWIEAEPPR